MLHHRITKSDIEKLAEMKTIDLEAYLLDIGSRVTHLRTVLKEARELETALGRELGSRRFLQD